MNRPKPTVSDAELEVLKALWKGGPGNVRDIAAQLPAAKRAWAYTTLQTLLNRLEAKGYVARDKDGTPHVFRAAVTREKLMRQRLLELADELCEGTATPLVMALVKDKKFTQEEIETFRRLLDDVETKKRG